MFFARMAQGRNLEYFQNYVLKLPARSFRFLARSLPFRPHPVMMDGALTTFDPLSL
jgi:hypothetical protein